MTYNPSIPQPTDNLSTSQGDLLGNFGQLNTQFGVDHQPFFANSANGNGLHQQVTYEDVQSITPTTVSAYPISGLYTKAFGTSTNLGQEQYFAEQRETNGLLEMYVPGVKVLGQINIVSGTASLVTTNTLHLNIQSVSWSAGLLTVDFTNNLDYATYFVYLTGIGASTTGVTTRSVSSVGIAAASANNTIFLMIF